MKCIVEDCDKEATKRSMCGSHYKKWWRYGDPTVCKHAPHGEPLRYLREDVLVYESDKCLPWPYGCNDEGYGQVIVDGARCYAHILVCERVNGPRPSSRHVVSHKCGNGRLGCVNPKHLKWQTYEEDCADKVTHGTSNRGERQGRSKLTEEIVREIRSLEGKMLQKDIAKIFGVDQSTISDIMRRRRWAWLEGNAQNDSSRNE